MIDPFIVGIDKALRTLFSAAIHSRMSPGVVCSENALSADDKAISVALMRINHVGEVCAQALYRGQSVVCSCQVIQQAFETASIEEADHLAWTEQRINELGGRKSLLGPFWYLGAFSLGVLAGKCGNQWSLGFLAETEKQVEAHLARHLRMLPIRDVKSRAIVSQMKIDESSHAEMAIRLGARALPKSAKAVMTAASGLMTRIAYYV